MGMHVPASVAPAQPRERRVPASVRSLSGLPPNVPDDLAYGRFQMTLLRSSTLVVGLGSSRDPPGVGLIQG